MTDSEFVYVTFIAAGQQKIWDALLKPEFTREYWGHVNLSDWKQGSPWEHRAAEGGPAKLVGTVQEIDPPNRLVMTWADPADAADMASPSRVTFELEPIEGMVRLIVVHDRLVPGSKMQKGITNGWPRVLSSLKSFLETGKPLPTWAKPASEASQRR